MDWLCWYHSQLLTIVYQTEVYCLVEMGLKSFGVFKERGLLRSTPLPFNQPQSILTIIHCGPSQKSTSPVTHGLNSATQNQGLQRDGGDRGWGDCRALFVMLINWPNLNNPDICCAACVKPHIQFVPPIQKAGKTLEAGKTVCVCVCVLVVDVVWVKGKNPFISMHVLKK